MNYLVLHQIQDFLETIFSSAKEGAELLFLIIIPAVAAVFFFIGALKFFGSLGCDRIGSFDHVNIYEY